MHASESYLSEERNHASLKHALLKKAYLPSMGEKTREEVKLESYERDQRLFSGRVTVRMEELGLHATDLAEATGLSVTAIGFILTGSTKYPRPETLFALADRLGLEPRWLGTHKGARLAASAPAGMVLIRGQEGKMQRSKMKLRTKR